MASANTGVVELDGDSVIAHPQRGEVVQLAKSDRCRLHSGVFGSMRKESTGVRPGSSRSTGKNNRLARGVRNRPGRRNLGRVIFLSSIQKELTARALKSAEALNLNLDDGLLLDLVRLVQSNKAVHIRTISKHRIVFRGDASTSIYYFVYNNKFKLIESFLSPGYAKISLGDQVWFRIRNRTIPSKVVAVIAPYADPAAACVGWTFDTSTIVNTGQRPQESYLVLSEGKLYWPNVRLLRKGFRQGESPGG